ncbi:hypothetical protein [Mesoterricola silvestris]|uniref:Uncharacterized protein n=1 Tax=Mesoterricola silvestris TaxID=2927979 RepID=A0AA48H6V1_9BACT|nr:hypothetical protein [Mesoterricola silvestris]BDU72903.1 hypothetical protein METEAL_20770 [Mesoterricola silvestris]
MSERTPKKSLYLPAPGDGEENGNYWFDQVNENFRKLDNDLDDLPIATSEVLGGVKIGDGISVDAEGRISVAGGSGPGTGGNDFYDITCSCPGYPAEGQMLLVLVAVRAFTLAAAGHRASALTLPSLAAPFICRKNGTAIGTITLGTSGAVTLTGWSATAFAVGDVLTVESPATLDLTLQDVGITLLGSA